MIGLTVVGKPGATVITSSPGLTRRFPSFGEVSAESATRLADEPELTSTHDAGRTASQSAAQTLGKAPGGQPEVKRRVDEVDELRSSNTRPAKGTWTPPERIHAPRTPPRGTPA